MPSSDPPNLLTIPTMLHGRSRYGSFLEQHNIPSSEPPHPLEMKDLWKLKHLYLLKLCYEIIYLPTFFFTKITQLKFLGLISLAGLIVYLYMMHFIVEDESRTYQMGKLCTIVTITMMASPLATMVR